MSYEADQMTGIDHQSQSMVSLWMMKQLILQGCDEATAMCQIENLSKAPTMCVGTHDETRPLSCEAQGDREGPTALLKVQSAE